MTVLEENKQNVRKDLILLKQDVETLKQMIQYIENHIDDVAEKDVENFDENVTEFKNKLEILELW